MTTPVPPHYRAFRYLLAAVVLCALGVTAWFVIEPTVLGSVLRLLGIG